ncbi:MAG: sialate O-acetylesterase [Opitutaceae bacterium]|nr:sialate O-acetylesterase [Opitutaceae bacterium]
MKHLRLLSLFAVLSAAALRADVRLPAVISNHMVLQRDAVVPIWGWADAGEKITVAFAGQTRTATAAADGAWRVALDPLRASDAGAAMTITGKNKITIDDVLVGEVWLGSGQSNMAMTVARSLNPEAEAATANFPRIRFFKETSGTATSPQKIGQGEWVLCSPQTVGSSSAVLYFFGRELHRKLSAPVGLINSSVGGTPIESWIAPEAQRAAKDLAPFFDAAKAEAAAIETPAARKKYAADLAAWQAAQKDAKATKKKAAKQPQDPAVLAARKGDVGGLFNGKIAPLAPYAVRGFLWYQGEANSVPAKAPFYAAQLRLLVTDWRARWGAGLPFAWAQLPNFTGAGRDWPLVREAMLDTLALPRTGMGINLDIGEANDIHPRNKQEAGRRLALWALGEVYNEKVPATSGPLPAGHEIRGSEIVLRFKHATGGLVAKGGPLRGFEIAGADRKWQPAQARIAGDTVIVSSVAVPQPVAARYAWENNPAASLFNGAGLPATPFRTERW